MADRSLWRVSFAGPTVDDGAFDALASAGFPMETSDPVSRYAGARLYDVVGRANDEVTALNAVRAALGEKSESYTHFRALRVEVTPLRNY